MSTKLKAKQLTLPPDYFTKCPVLVGSSNGLLCFHSRYDDGRSHTILNPLTNEAVRLPMAPPRDSLAQLQRDEFDDTFYWNYLTAPSGFGFDDTTKTYKVIQAWGCYNDDGRRKAVFNMITLGSPKWTRIHEKIDMFMDDQTSPVFLNNALHWQMYTSIGPESHPSITAINLGPPHTLTTLQLPPIYGGHGHVKYTSLTSLNGCLCHFGVIDYASIALWVMKDYGVDSSWSREYTIPLGRTGVQPFPGPPRGRRTSEDGFRTLTTMKNGITLVADSEYIVYCDFENNEYQVLDISGELLPIHKPGGTAPVAHIGSLISPKTIAAGAEIKIRPRRNVKRPSTYCEL